MIQKTALVIVFIALMSNYHVDSLAQQCQLLPKGGCSQITSCHECVTQYVIGDDPTWRYPYLCSWCPQTNTCEMLEDGYPSLKSTCSTGQAYTGYCPIRVPLPRCIYLRYSYWFCYSGKPEGCGICDTNFVNDFCVLKTKDKELKICNGDSFYLEARDDDPFYTPSTVLASKNPYGLEIKLNGFLVGQRDLKRIETQVVFDDSSSDDKEDKWFCNTGNRLNNKGHRTTVIKYKVKKDPTPSSSSQGINSNNKDESTPSLRLENNSSAGSSTKLLVQQKMICSIIFFMWICFSFIY